MSSFLPKIRFSLSRLFSWELDIEHGNRPIPSGDTPTTNATRHWLACLLATRVCTYERDQTDCLFMGCGYDVFNSQCEHDMF